MCVIVMVICMAIFGIIALVRGQFTLTRAKVVSGVPARIIGVVLLLPFPLMLAGGLLVGIILAMQGKQPRPEDVQGIGAVIEIAILLLCMVIAVIIGLATARPMKRRLPEDLEEDYDRRFREDDYPSRERADPDGLRPPEDGIRE